MYWLPVGFEVRPVTTALLFELAVMVVPAEPDTSAHVPCVFGEPVSSKIPLSQTEILVFTDAAAFIFKVMLLDLDGQAASLNVVHFKM